MKRRNDPIFVGRGSYCRRRLMDAARVLPLVGLFLFFLPLLWGPGVATTTGLTFIFGTWAGLIVAILFISRGLARVVDSEDAEDT